MEIWSVDRGRRLRAGDRGLRRRHDVEVCGRLGSGSLLVGSSPNVHIELTGFQPSSEVTVARDGPANPQVSEPGAGSRPVGGPDPAAPLVFRVAADGTNGGAVLGIVGSTGPVTLTLSGTAATGTAVVLSLVAE